MLDIPFDNLNFRDLILYLLSTLNKVDKWIKTYLYDISNEFHPISSYFLLTLL